MPVYFTPENQRKLDNFSSETPAKVYLPLNIGRYIPRQQKFGPLFKHERPSNSIEIGSWLNNNDAWTPIVNYDAGNGAHVWASGYGIEFSKNQSTGEYTFTIPDGVDIYRANVLGEPADGDSNDEIFVAFNNEIDNKDYNQSIQTAWKPIVNISDGDATVSRSAPALVNKNISYGIASVGSSNLELTLFNATTYFNPFLLTFNFL